MEWGWYHGRRGAVVVRDSALPLGMKWVSRQVKMPQQRRLSQCSARLSPQHDVDRSTAAREGAVAALSSALWYGVSLAIGEG